MVDGTVLSLFFFFKVPISLTACKKISPEAHMYIVIYIYIYPHTHTHAVLHSVAQRFWLFATPWTAECQASLTFRISWCLLTFMSIESVMPSHRLILLSPSPPALNTHTLCCWPITFSSWANLCLKQILCICLYW